MPKMEQARTDHSCGGGWHAALDGGGGGGGGREIGFELIGVPFREARRRARSTLLWAFSGGFLLGLLLQINTAAFLIFVCFFVMLTWTCACRRGGMMQRITQPTSRIFFFLRCAYLLDVQGVLGWSVFTPRKAPSLSVAPKHSRLARLE